MPHVETLIRRPALSNTALYALPAVVYTATLFTLEIIRPFQYVFAPQSVWRDRFSYLSIISWPIIVFGALILVAVRIGARSRRRRSKRSKRNTSRRLAPTGSQSSAVPQAPPRAHIPSDDTIPVTVEAEGMEGIVDTDTERTNARRGSMLGRRRRRRRRKLPRGYVSVTKMQRLFAGFGFLWVAVGMASTCGCAVFVFFGQRERNVVDSAVSGVVEEDKFKTIAVPVLTGIVPALVFLFMTITSLVRFKNVVRAKGKLVNTPAGSEAGYEDRADPVDVQVVFDGGHAPLPVTPDHIDLAVMLDNLRHEGFPNTQTNLAALEAASYDMQVAREKLANTRATM